MKVTLSLFILHLFLNFIFIEIKANTPPQTGNSDYALFFNGFLGHVAFSQNITNYPTDELTLALWIKLDPIQPLQGGTPFNTKGPTVDGEFTVMRSLPFEVIVNGNYARSKVFLEKEEWKIIVVKWSTKTGLVEGYVDWEPLISETINKTIGKHISPEVWVLLGQDTDSALPIPPWDAPNDDEYYGYVDEIFLWKRQVEISDLKDFFTKKALDLNSQTAQGLVAHWPFSEGYGYISTDVISGWNLYLGGGNDGVLVPFQETAVPLWVISSTPVYKNEFTTSYVPNQNKLLEIPVNDPDSDTITITVTSIPEGKIYIYDSNVEGFIGKEISSVPKVLSGNKLWYISSKQVLPENKDSFTYSVSDGSNDVQATISLQANSRPVAYSFSNYTYEDTLTVVRLLAHDTDEDSLTFTISSFPSNGTLYHFESQEPIQEGDIISDIYNRILYLPDKDQFGKALSKFSFMVNDGVQSTIGTISMTVEQVSDVPIAPVLTYETDEEVPILISFDSVYDSDPNDFVLIKHITKLPTYGTLYQQTEKGRGSPILTLEGPIIETPRQYTSHVFNYSSHYDYHGTYTANDTRGPPDCLERFCDATPHQDCETSWSPLTQSEGIDGKGLEFLEIGIDDAVYLTQVEVYENLSPGTVFQIDALIIDPNKDIEQTLTEMQVDSFISSDNIETTITTVTTTTSKILNNTEQTQNYNRLTIWQGEPQQGLFPVARIFSPTICETDLKAIGVRVWMNTSAINGWNEVDSIAVIGSYEQRPRGLVVGGKGLWYVPPKDWYGQVTINYQVYDCSHSSSDSQILITVNPVNDSPRPLNSSYKSEVLLNVETEILLHSYDPENDTMTWTIVKLPKFGVLIDPSNHQIISSVNHSLPSPKIIFLANDESNLDLSFEWTVKDVFNSVSSPIIYEVTVSCPPGTFLEVSSKSCVICPSDSYSEVTNSLSCSRCPAGYDSPAGSSSCSKDILSITDKARGAGLAVSIIGLVYLVVCLIIFISLRKNSAIRASNIHFCFIIIIGGISVCISTIISSTEGDVRCYLPPWFLGIGLSLSFSSIVIKNAHVYSILNMKEFDSVANQITITTLFVFAFIATLPTLLILIVWQVEEGGFTENIETIDKSFVKICSSGNEWTYRGLLYLYNGFLLALCLGIAVLSRNIKSHFNESKVLGLTIYNTTLCSILAVVVNTLLKANPSNQYLSTLIVIVFGVCSSISIFFGYKFYRCFHKPQSTTGKITTTGSSSVVP